MVGWYHWLNEHEFEWALGTGDGQGSLACCSPWGSQTVRHNWATELNWTELNIEAGRWSEGMFRIAEAWGKPKGTQEWSALLLDLSTYLEVWGLLLSRKRLVFKYWQLVQIFTVRPSNWINQKTEFPQFLKKFHFKHWQEWGKYLYSSLLGQLTTKGGIKSLNFHVYSGEVNSGTFSWKLAVLIQ